MEQCCVGLRPLNESKMETEGLVVCVESESVHVVAESQETPSVQPEFVGLKETSKLKQGRLLFTPPSQHHTPSNGEDPTLTITNETTTPTPDTSASSNNNSPLENMETQSTPNTLTTQQPTSEPKTPKTTKPKLSKAEREALKAKKEKERAEARAKREAERQRKEAEKLQKEQEKKEKQRKREQEMKERQEKKEREELEKKERKEKREAERRKKEEERKRKEEERKKKEDEKKRVELEKEQAKEEKLRKEQQKREKFLSFFTKLPPKESPPKRERSETTTTWNRDEFEESFRDQNSDSNYLETIKGKPRQCIKMTSDGQSKSTVLSDSDDVIIMSSHQTRRKFKLLQFHENHRPAYYGTWRKKSKIISPRNPLNKDTGLLDYEVDSDEEWEEEDPGESVSDSEGEDAESGEDSDDDDGFFVPHGYLSDGEGDQSDGELGGDPLTNGDDYKKQKQMAKAKAWEAEFQRKCQHLKVIKIGCVWNSGTTHKSNGEEKEETKSSRNVEFLQQFAAVPLVELPISMETRGETTADGQSTSSAFSENTKRPVPEEAMVDLIRHIHGNSIGLTRLINTFLVHWGSKMMVGSEPQQRSPSSSPPPPPAASENRTPMTSASMNSECIRASGISKRQLEMKIQAIAIKEVRPPSHKPLWFVHDSVFKQYGLDPSSLVPLPTRETSKSVSPSTPNTTAMDSAKKKKRKLEGNKSLLECLNMSPMASSSSLFGGDSGISPKPKRPKMDNLINKDSAMDVAQIVKIANKLLADNDSSLLSKHERSKEEELDKELLPASKKCHLDQEEVFVLKPSCGIVEKHKENSPAVLNLKEAIPAACPAVPQ